MKKEKNVFLTTLSETKNRLDINYYMCETSVGTNIYTTGISSAEAGVKYMLSLYHIDEIVMIGSVDDMNEAAFRSITNSSDHSSEFLTTLADVTISDITDYDHMSEYDFLNYRITEFMRQIDLELLDIAELVSAERQEELDRLLEQFKSRHAKGIGFREFFARLTTDEVFEECFNKEILSELNYDEKRWVKYHIYHKMDSFYKMHLL